MSLTLYGRVQALQALNLSSTVYVALHTGNPGDAGSANEVTDSAYSRLSATFTFNSATGTYALSTALTWPAANGSYTITHISIKDAATGGNTLVRQALTAAVSIAAGGTPAFAVGDITVGGPQ